MRILYIHQYFATRNGKTGTRSYEFAKHLLRRGHRVTMLTSVSDLSDVQIPAGKKQHRFVLEGIDVIAVRVAYSQKMGVARRILSFLQFMALSTWIACREVGHDVVFATSTPLTVGVPGLLASWVLRIPLVFEVRDLWPEAPFKWELCEIRC